MKRTVNANIGSRAFTVDEDAFKLLSDYLDDIAGRLEDSETLDDIEARIADLLSERLNPPFSVVNIDMVRNAIGVIGRAEIFGERRRGSTSADEDADLLPRKKFFRSRNKRILGGICGGAADYFDTDTTLVRIITFLLIFPAGLSLWVYIILWIVLPVAETTPGYGIENKSKTT